jgi:hypothetical protein
VVFGVAKKETVTILVTPISVGAFCAAAHDGDPLVDLSPTKKHFKYVFTVSKAPPGIEIAVIAAQFMGTEPSTARYEIEVSGSNGGSFDVSAIKKPSGSGPSERSRTLQFDVE